MIKKCLIIVLIFLLFCVSCNKNTSSLEIKIIDGTLTSEGIAIEIKNISKDLTFSFGDSYELQKKTNNKWINIEEKNKEGIHLEKQVILPNEIAKIEFSWENRYGNLGKGEYRIVKHVYETKGREKKEINRIIYVNFCLLKTTPVF